MTEQPGIVVIDLGDARLTGPGRRSFWCRLGLHRFACRCAACDCDEGLCRCHRECGALICTGGAA